MSEDAEPASSPARLSTGIPGLDRLLGGGLYQGGIYVVTGSPGTGKTTFGNQMSFRYAADGGQAAYVTLLSETHARMLFQMRGVSFFQPAAVGAQVVYLNGFSVIEAEGLDGLLKMVRQAVRDQRAGLLVLEGLVAAGPLARIGIDCKKFINELQSWVGVVGCTVLFLTSDGAEQHAQPENSMVDGIFELASVRRNLQASRQLTIAKFRGSAFREGTHGYCITSEGMTVFRRLEAMVKAPAEARGTERASLGDAGLDRVMGGGLVRGTSTLLLGPVGSGKTTAGLQFLGAGLARKEAAVYCGFVESPSHIVRRGELMGLGFEAAAQAGSLAVRWHSPAEALADMIGHDVIEAARRTGARRVFIDGVMGFAASAPPERLPAFMAALAGELAALGATTLICDDAGEVLAPDGEILTPGLGTFTDNVLVLQDLSTGLEAGRLVTVLKTRQSAHDVMSHQYEIDGRSFRVQVPPGGPPPEPALPVARAKKPRHPR